MIIIKELIKYDNANCIEVTWVETLEEVERVIHCQAYADVQMDMLRADALKYGTPLDEYEDIIQEVNDSIIPSTQEELDKLLKQSKQYKLIELEAEKDKEQDKPVLVRDIYFFGGRSNGQKYKEAFDLAKLLGKTTGEVRAVDRMTEVDEAFTNEILTAIGVSTYEAWYKLEQMKLLVENAKTLQELNEIEW